MPKQPLSVNSPNTGKGLGERIANDGLQAAVCRRLPPAKMMLYIML
ncbi:hypothetical protein [Rouxiella sp. WC2420]|uniref:Uncharacterized protein n=1 Tax=Rouxiella sp. WC2420 TaxID=3234145 RepID=A0AB39VVG3_9GAMM